MLNLGCGRDVRDGWVNVDRQWFEGVDIIWNLDDTPWPFKGESTDRIDALDVFEHVADIVSVMDECHRVLRQGGVLRVRGPLANGSHHWIDPTHRRAFVAESLDYFCRNTERGRRYGYGAGSWLRVSVRVANDNVEFVLRKG